VARNENEKMENNTRLVYQIAEVAAMLGLSRNACYQAVQRGELPAIRIGKRLLVPKASLFKLLDGAKHDH